MQELQIEGFPDYCIDETGQVTNMNTGHVLATRQNHQGITMVNLVKGGHQHTKSLAVLVAKHFLEPHPLPAFDTPIHLDGDKRNCYVDNLMWRPRWFAIRYHQQFAKDPIDIFTEPIICLDTDEIFETPRQASIALGVLELDIVHAIRDQKGVWPYGYDFRIHKE